MRSNLKNTFHQLGLGAAIGLLLSATSAQAKPTTFVVDDATGRDVVSFSSNAPIELVEGRTNKIRGTVVLDNSLDLRKGPIEAIFTVDLTSIDTGIELRNTHMRDNFMETGKHPQASFKLTKFDVKQAVLKPGQTIRVDAQGEFSVHGNTVAKTVPVDVTYFGPCDEAEKKSRACDSMIIRATFPVKLEEHGIKRPEMLFQKLADTVYVKVSATARRDDTNLKTSAR